ncbi:MAG: T9SS type A sorting domain-containing protein [bacterium]|jgi:hypothetical protein
MKSIVNVIAVCLLIVAFFSAASGGNLSSNLKPRLVDNESFINANSILMFITNRGLFGRDISGHFGYDYGTFYPYFSIAQIENGTEIKSPLFSGGLWLGGKVSGETRVAVAEFGTEFWPGPMEGNTYISDADTVTAFRVYKLYSDSMQSNPNTDYLEWPLSQGAPVDGSGNPLLLGNQTLFSVYNDANPSTHNLTAGSSAPLGIEVRQLTWASESTSRSRIIYLEYRLFNRSTENISDFYLSIFLDPDIGGTQDDLTGCDTLSGIIFSYNATNIDAVYGSAPPAIGVKMLYGPIISSIDDTAYFFGARVPGFKNLPISSFIGYPNGDDPQSAEESYNLMRGLRRNGLPLANGTKFSYPGDPVTGTGDLQIIAGNPHFVGTFGPIDFPAGDSQYVLMKLGIGQGSDRLSSLTDLRYILNLPDSLHSDIPDISHPLPEALILEQNHPNPFNAETVIEFSIVRPGYLELAIYNLLGQKVAAPFAGIPARGLNRVSWNAHDYLGKPLPSGIYFYRLSSDEFSLTKKMILLR